MATEARSNAPRPLETPFCNCLLLCDEVLQSVAAHKHILHGIIGVIRVPTVPVTVGPVVAYLRLSNLYGAQEITVRLFHPDDDEPVMEFRVQSPAQPDPLGVYTLVVPIPAFGIEKPGRYIFEASAAGHEMASSPILVVGPSEAHQ
jgi:hypothetical protein